MFPVDSSGTGSAIDYVIQICDEEGNLIDEFTDVDLRTLTGVQFYQEMKDMYESARRQALGVDAAIDSLLREIGDPNDDPF